MMPNIQLHECESISQRVGDGLFLEDQKRLTVEFEEGGEAFVCWFVGAEASIPAAKSKTSAAVVLTQILHSSLRKCQKKHI